MKFAAVLALISGATAMTLSPRAECPTSSGSSCGTVSVLGKTVTFPSCTCETTCEGDTTISGITAHVGIGKCK